jgi:hypothetical protein
VKRLDADAVVLLALRLHSTPVTRESIDEITRDFMNHTTENEGTPGSGACICRWPPEKAKDHCEQTHQTFEVYKGSLLLDHRCSHHGEKAQPTLWGRHKILELSVTPQQWTALGVERNTLTVTVAVK